MYAVLLRKCEMDQFFQSYPKRSFANPMALFCTTCWPREKLSLLLLRFWNGTKTFIEGIVYYLELLIPFHATANRTRFRVHHTARNQTKQQTIRNSKLKWEPLVHEHDYRSIDRYANLNELRSGIRPLS